MERRVVKTVKLKSIHLEESLYPRSTYNWQTGYDYAESMKTGAKFPPITLALLNNRLILVDGKHRIEATKLCKKDEIEAEIFTGWDRKRIFVEAVKRNIAHGRVLSPFEKRRITMKLRELNLKPEEISKIVQIPQQRMEKFIQPRLVHAITGERMVPEVVKSGIKHKAGESFDKETLDEAQVGMYIKNQLYLFDELINLFQNELVDLKNPKIREKILILEGFLFEYTKAK